MSTLLTRWRKCFFGFAVLFFLSITGGIASAASYALLVGVSEYPSDYVRSLKGPANDVDALYTVLIEKLGYQKENIKKLVNEKATKKNILEALRELISIRKTEDDTVFLYFSGHGTSSNARTRVPDKANPARVQDKANPFHLPQETGAFFPYDFKIESRPELTRQRLLVGKVDFRDLFTQLQEQCPVMVVFDACFSGNIRAIDGIGGKTNRYTNPPPGTDLSSGTPDRSYPYDNLVYFSSSSDFQESIDSPFDDVTYKDQGDILGGKAHGVFTAALLYALHGQADNPRDRQLSPDELEAYISVWLEARGYKQVPQLLVPKDRSATTPFFTIIAPEKPSGQQTDAEYSNIHIKFQSLHPLSPAVRNSITASPNISIVAANGDVLYLLDKGRPALALPNGRLLGYIDREDELPQYLKGYQASVYFGRIALQPQKIPLSLQITGGSGVVIEGQTIGFSMQSEKPGYFLLFNLTANGHCNILYPYCAKETEKTATLNMPGVLDIIPPYGTDLFIGILFSEKPPFWGQIPDMAKDNSKSDALLPLVIKAIKTPAFAAGKVIRLESRPASDIIR